MGRSASCFKIITCGSDSTDRDDVEVPETKGSSDKRGWSFRKRSERHRVLSNTVLAETPSGHKESPESVPLNFQSSDSTFPEKPSTVPEKTCTSPEKTSTVPEKPSPVPEKPSVVEYTEENSQLLTLVDQKGSELVASVMKGSEGEGNLDESVVVIIQTAVRGFLARRELVKLTNLIKLQAAVRGHLVRRHAVGTLRCVQAIVKMQALVRARRARLSLEESYTENKSDSKNEKDSQNMKQGAKLNVKHSSIEKLLSNRYARQLMESTPKTKPIHIKCDPSKPNSAWNWLERWMSVSAAEQTTKPGLMKEEPGTELTNEQHETEKIEKSASSVDLITTSEAFCEPTDSKSSVRESIVPSESEDNLITYDADDFKFQACQPTSSVKDILEQTQLEKEDTSVEINHSRNQNLKPDANSETEVSHLPYKPEVENDQPKRSMKRYASEQLETEGKKYVFGSRKASSPAFIAAQTKFEELSSTANSGKSISSSYQDTGVESNLDTVSLGTDSVNRTKELSITESPAPNSVGLQHGGSECGTELSITSTLDSPDRSDVGTTDYEHGAKVSEQENCRSDSAKDIDVKGNDTTTSSVPDFSSVTDQPDNLDDNVDKSGSLVVVVDTPQVEQEPKKDASDLHRELDSETGRQTYRSSPEASPRSHMTVPESQGTPSSQVSVKAKKNKTDKSNQKRKSLSAGKSPAHDSGGRSSVEQLPKEQKSGKRRNSFGSTKPENIDQEPRDSNSSSSVPHFMQATESARAKVQANNSPRSSPDVHDRDIYIKKRHSLPGANGRQGSPRIQRSMSQAQQGIKANERKWQR